MPVSQMNPNRVMLMAAPLQGLTGAPFRRFHSELFSSEAIGVEYFTPFLRVEKGEVRRRDLADAVSPMSVECESVPQIIFRDEQEFNLLCETLVANGFSRIDLNMGCPFPPQVSKGRGAGFLRNLAQLEKVGCAAERFRQESGVEFSIKMRLGVEDTNEWLTVLPSISRFAPTHVVVHPRTARQQYSGTINYEQFDMLKNELHEHSRGTKVIFNGEIKTPADIDSLLNLFSDIDGIMVGRGLISRPSLFNEWLSHTEFSEEKRGEDILRLHERLFKYYRTTLCGETQILMKMKPYWEYFGESFNRKQVKAIMKSNTLAAYSAAVKVISH